MLGAINAAGNVFMVLFPRVNFKDSMLHGAPPSDGMDDLKELHRIHATLRVDQVFKGACCFAYTVQP